MKSTDFTDNTLNGYLTINNGVVSFSKTIFEDYSFESPEKFTLKLRYEDSNSSVIPGGISSEVIVSDTSIPVFDTDATQFSSGGVFISTYRSGNIGFPTTLYFTGSGLSTSTIFTDNSLTGSFNFVDSGDGKIGIGTIIRTIDSGNLGIGSFSIVPENLSFDIRLGGIGGTVLGNTQISIYQNPYNIGVNTELFDLYGNDTLTAQILGVGIGATSLYYTVTGISTLGFSDGLLSGPLITNSAGLGIIQKTSPTTFIGVGTTGSFDIRISTGSTLGPVVAASTTINYNLATRNTVGQQSYTVPGTYTWVCPFGVTSVHFVLIGGGGGGATSTQSSNGVSGGGGGGGGLSWRNSYSVSSGDVLYITVGSAGSGGTAAGQNNNTAGGDSYIRLTSHSGTIIARAGGGGKGEYNNPVVAFNGGTDYSSTYGGGGSNSGGGTGGRGGRGEDRHAGGGGGGAGGYAGNGGQGNDGSSTSSVNAPAGGGGGGSGSINQFTATVTICGGGTDILGQGTSGTGTGGNSEMSVGGYQGSTGGPNGSGNTVVTKNYGGGGAGAEDDSSGGAATGGTGAVRIIWGNGRSFPSTLTYDIESIIVGASVESIYGSADITKTSFPESQTGSSSGSVDVLVAITGTFSTTDTGTLIDLGGTGTGVSAGLNNGVLRGSAFSGDNITWGDDADSSKIEYDMSSILNGSTEVTIYLVANKLDKVLYAYLKIGNTIQLIATGKQAASPGTNTFGSNTQGYGEVGGDSIANLNNNPSDTNTDWEDTFNNPSNIDSIKVWHTNVNLSNFPNSLI